MNLGVIVPEGNAPQVKVRIVTPGYPAVGDIVVAS